MCVVAINVTDVVNAGVQHAILPNRYSPNKRLSIAIVHTKVVNCNSAFKSQ